MNLVYSSKSIRKNITLDSDVSRKLEEMADYHQLSQSAMIAQAINSRYQAFRRQKRLAAFEKAEEIAEMFDYSDEVSVQTIKSGRDDI